MVYENLGPRIKNLRVHRGWTRVELAEKIGVTPGYVTHLENGTKIPSLDTLVLLANTMINSKTLQNLINLY